MKVVPRISDAEWQVMRELWKSPGLSAHGVIEALSTRESWSPATIKTLLNRLIKKKALTFKKEGKSYLYWPAVAEDRCAQHQAEGFLDRFFDGALSPMLTHFVKAKRLTKAEIEELEEILRRGKSHD